MNKRNHSKSFIPSALILITGSVLFGAVYANYFWIAKNYPLATNWCWSSLVFHPAIVALVSGFLYIVWFLTERKRP